MTVNKHDLVGRRLQTIVRHGASLDLSISSDVSDSQVNEILPTNLHPGEDDEDEDQVRAEAHCNACLAHPRHEYREPDCARCSTSRALFERWNRGEYDHVAG